MEKGKDMSQEQQGGGCGCTLQWSRGGGGWGVAGGSGGGGRASLMKLEKKGPITQGPCAIIISSKGKSCWWIGYGIKTGTNQNSLPDFLA